MFDVLISMVIIVEIIQTVFILDTIITYDVWRRKNKIEIETIYYSKSHYPDETPLYIVPNMFWTTIRVIVSLIPLLGIAYALSISKIFYPEDKKEVKKYKNSIPSNKIKKMLEKLNKKVDFSDDSNFLKIEQKYKTIISDEIKIHEDLVNNVMIAYLTSINTAVEQDIIKETREKLLIIGNEAVRSLDKVIAEYKDIHDKEKKIAIDMLSSGIDKYIEETQKSSDYLDEYEEADTTQIKLIEEPTPNFFLEECKMKGDYKNLSAEGYIKSQLQTGVEKVLEENDNLEKFVRNINRRG